MSKSGKPIKPKMKTISKEVNLDTMSIIELKALMFDLEQDIRQINEKYNTVGQVLQKRLNEQDNIKKDDDK